MPTAGILVPGISRRCDYAVSWNNVDLGLLDEVDPTGLKMKFSPITTGSTGGKDNVLGHRFVGTEGSIKVQMRQCNLAQFSSLAPWASTAPFAMTPQLNVDMYTYAQPLVLHPLDVTGTTEDDVFPLTVPIKMPGLVKRDGGKDDVWEVEFMVYPNRTTMSTTPLVISPGAVKGT